MKTYPKAFVILSISFIILLFWLFQAIIADFFDINFDERSIEKMKSSHVTVFDFHRPLALEYDAIPCRKSINYYVTTTLCFHNFSVDRDISVNVGST